MESLAYTLLPSSFGIYGVVWQEKAQELKIYRIFLPDNQTSVENLAQKSFPNARPLISPFIKELDERIQQFFEGEEVAFVLDHITLKICSEFQKRILLAEYKIPRG